MSSASLGQQQADGPQKRRFIPGDICVVVTSGSALDTVSRAAIYDVVREALFNAPDRGKIPPLGPREEEPTFFFDDDEGGTIAHLYYRQATENLSDAERDDAVRSTVVALNAMYALPSSPPDLFRDVKPDALQKLRIVAVAPHWIGVGCGAEGDGDGPAAPPEFVGPPADPAHPENWRFRFTSADGTRGNADLHGYVQSARNAATPETDPANIVVAILDTCPTNDAIHQALTQFGGNSLLGQIGDPTMPKRSPGNQVAVEGSIAATANEFALVGDTLPLWSGRMDAWLGTGMTTAAANKPARLKALRESVYSMPDHGLFVAGIIKDIAPMAEIHLVQALDDAGVTNLVAFVRTLKVMLNTSWGGPRSNGYLIVSLSLTFSVPTYDEFQQEWAIALDGLGALEITEIYMRVHRNLKDAIAILTKRNILLVAAVGNYNESGAARPDPRYPAIYDSVLAVASVSRERSAAQYTNRGATLAPIGVNGIATFGGDTDVAQEPRIIEQEPHEPPDAIRGLYSSMALPFPATAATAAIGNTTGWAVWVGTSFATPIIAGVAAVLWERESTLRPNTVIAANQMIGIVQGYADAGIATQADLGCDTIFAEQELIP